MKKIILTNSTEVEQEPIYECDECHVELGRCSNCGCDLGGEEGHYCDEEFNKHYCIDCGEMLEVEENKVKDEVIEGQLKLFEEGS